MAEQPHPGALVFLSDQGTYGPLPIPSDLEAMERIRSRIPPDLASLCEAAPFGPLFDAIAGNSPYLSRLILSHPDHVAEILTMRPDVAMQALVVGLRAEAAAANSSREAMSVLRRAKARGVLIIALADLAGVWPLARVTAALSQLADEAVRAALSWHLSDAHRGGRLVLPNPDIPMEGCGLAVLAMGKHGAGELNFSSDIDLVVFFEPEHLPVPDGKDAQKAAIQITQGLARMLQDMTPEGYVFRVDLRLRPDPGIMPVAVSLSAAERYYEALGQNWERAAYIKARSIAGDPGTCQRVEDMMGPFVWRKYLDYATIEDIHAIKRQINAHAGANGIAIEGHNIKLGRGGIREIEFFAQTQQLIAGGRVPALREPTTVGALEALEARGMVDSDVAQDLRQSYTFLRVLEHRLQMVADEQTHTMPRDEEGVARIAAFCGWRDSEVFRKVLTAHLVGVKNHYAGLFESEPSLSERSGSLVFTGVEDDPETLQTLWGMGFTKPSAVCGAIRAWHHGRMSATKTARARAMLTKITPVLLESFAATTDPDTAFLRFDSFLKGLPAGVQLFSLMLANPDLLELLADILGMSPRFAETLSRNPGVLDSLLDPGFVTSLPGPRRLEGALGESLSQTSDFEEILSRTRRFAREHSFRIGVQILNGTIRAAGAGAAHSYLAQSVIRRLMEPVAARMVERHGTVSDGAVAVLALGKLGSLEMMASSDLDLIIVYDYGDGLEGAMIGEGPIIEEGATAEGGAEGGDALRALRALRSDGHVPIHPSQYFTRYSQRLIAALTAPTADGDLYEVDMRLRPSGRSGPLATRLAAFEAYHAQEAWTWEHMALTRARVVAGDVSLGRRARKAIDDILCARVPVKNGHAAYDPPQIRADAANMRARMTAETPTTDPWSLKSVRGGLIDVEFIAQTLQLVHAPRHPDILHTNTVRALERAVALGLLPEKDGAALVGAAFLFQGLGQVLTLAGGEMAKPGRLSASLEACMLRTAGLTTMEQLERQILLMQSVVMELFATHVGHGQAGES